ncbi:NAD(P)H-hydrate dehydratase [Hyphomicrobiales bacterium BP6-180914]|uniref:Bifunctional NAD(P)H-hydrate repair enzyme n=2 Tax=Lichenifustis flavocetrariae TaxID=2949735 RepID=A0AA41YUG5_9HYPH|nr:NAD(P)H-hydrate dehydratase [Lichenifustis flavocetrariae]
MAEADRRTIAAGTDGYTLMQRAGRAVADACEVMLPGASRFAAVLCGPGNNGGDGFVAARLLKERGWSVSVHVLEPRDPSTGDAARAKADWPGDIHGPDDFDPSAADLVIDALFGAGLKRGLSGQAERLVQRLKDADTPVVAVDIPSGVDGSSGMVTGVAVDATLTVTFGCAKPGHYLYPGRRHRGRLVVSDIGLGPLEPHPATMLNDTTVWLQAFPWPDQDGHKYKRGHTIVVSGSLAHTGAARLAARGALRIGAGLVTLASPKDALSVNAAHLTAVMLREVNGPDDLAELLSDSRLNCVVMGPGLGVGAVTRSLVAVALAPRSDLRDGQSPRACLLDADALTSFSGDAGRLRDLIRSTSGAVVITPHDGEFARLFSNEPAILAGSKLDRSRKAAQFLGCVVLLKGPDTVVADPKGRATISDGGSPWLATAGSGDVLSGFIGGLLTQGMPAFEAAAAGDHLHTIAAKIFGPGLIAEDIPEQLPAALRMLQAEGGAAERGGTQPLTLA